MDINDAFPSNYLKAEDLAGREHEVTIAECTIERLGDDHKPVLTFIGKSRGLVLNKTNATRIAEQYGSQTESWKGKKIVIYPTQTEFGGRTVPCIRVKRKPLDEANQVDAAGDDIPF